MSLDSEKLKKARAASLGDDFAKRWLEAAEAREKATIKPSLAQILEEFTKLGYTVIPTEYIDADKVVISHKEKFILVPKAIRLGGV